MVKRLRSYHTFIISSCHEIFLRTLSHYALSPQMLETPGCARQALTKVQCREILPKMQQTFMTGEISSVCDNIVKLS